MWVFTRPLAVLGPQAASRSCFDIADADQMTAGTTPMTEQCELGDAFWALAQSCQSETNTRAPEPRG